MQGGRQGARGSPPLAMRLTEAYWKVRWRRPSEPKGVESGGTPPHPLADGALSAAWALDRSGGVARSIE